MEKEIHRVNLNGNKFKCSCGEKYFFINKNNTKAVCIECFKLYTCKLNEGNKK